MNKVGKRRLQSLGVGIPLFIVLFTLLAGMYQALRIWQSRHTIDRLVEASRRFEPASYSLNAEKQRLHPRTYSDIRKRIISNPDFESYHLLLALRDVAPNSYREVPTDVKCAVLTSALSQSVAMTDWSMLTEWLCRDELAAKALLETGFDCVPYLGPILDDQSDAFLDGSAERMTSMSYKLRKCDYAYIYLCLIMNWDYVLLADPKDRDRQISIAKSRFIVR